MAVAYTSRDMIGVRSAAGGCLAMIYTVYKALVLEWGLWRQISMTPRKLQQITSCVTVLLLSTDDILTTLESGSRQFGV